VVITARPTSLRVGPRVTVGFLGLWFESRIRAWHLPYFTDCASEMARRGCIGLASNMVDLFLRALSGSIIHLARPINGKRA